MMASRFQKCQSKHGDVNASERASTSDGRQCELGRVRVQPV